MIPIEEFAGFQKIRCHSLTWDRDVSIPHACYVIYINFHAFFCLFDAEFSMENLSE